METHAESGGVYPNLSRARPATFKTTCGAALRVRTDTGVVGALGFDWSPETVRVWFTLGGLE